MLQSLKIINYHVKLFTNVYLNGSYLYAEVSKSYRQLLHWQPVKIRVFSFLLKDDKLGAVLTEGGSLFQMREMREMMMVAYF